MKSITKVVLILLTIISTACSMGDTKELPLVLYSYTESVEMPDTIAQADTAKIIINHWTYTECDKFLTLASEKTDSGIVCRAYVESPVDGNCEVRLKTMATTIELLGQNLTLGYYKLYFSESDSSYVVDSLYIKQ